MGHKYTVQETALYKAIDEILLNDWDPIGISNEPGARHEYYSYLPLVYDMARNNKTAEQIGSYLFSIETNAMGIPSTLERCISVAERILETKQKFLE